VQAATRAGIPLLNDAILFASCNTPARVIGITGTNGKSTTTALIHHLLQQAGKDSLNDSQIGGNFGHPAAKPYRISAAGHLCAGAVIVSVRAVGSRLGRYCGAVELQHRSSGTARIDGVLCGR
jgi:hypothetical protein